jgi:hypothetical protein
MKQTMYQRFGHIIDKMVAQSDPELFSTTTAENVFQKGERQNLRYHQYIMEQLMLEGSGLEGFANIEKLYNLAQQGKSALILSAHFTNYDVVALYALMQQAGVISRRIFESLVFIAGRKLTEGAPPHIKAMSETFTRLVISAKSGAMTTEEVQTAMAINKASQKALNKMRYDKKIFYLYPTGTRSRAGRQETYRGLREIYNYLKKFDYFLCCGISGNLLPARDDAPMLDEYPQSAVVKYHFGEVLETKRILNDVESGLNGDTKDKKQAVIDHIMTLIYKLGQHPSEL